MAVVARSVIFGRRPYTPTPDPDFTVTTSEELQAALFDCVGGETIALEDGTYDELDFSFIRFPLTAPLIIAPADPTTLDDPPGVVLTSIIMQASTGFTFRGVTIRSTDIRPGSLSAGYNDTLAFEDCQVGGDDEDHKSRTAGLAFREWVRNVKVRYCTIQYLEMPTYPDPEAREFMGYGFKIFSGDHNGNFRFAHCHLHHLTNDAFQIAISGPFTIDTCLVEEIRNSGPDPAHDSHSDVMQVQSCGTLNVVNTIFRNCDAAIFQEGMANRFIKTFRNVLVHELDGYWTVGWSASFASPWNYVVQKSTFWRTAAGTGNPVGIRTLGLAPQGLVVEDSIIQSFIDANEDQWVDNGRTNLIPNGGGPPADSTPTPIFNSDMECTNDDRGFRMPVRTAGLLGTFSLTQPVRAGTAATFQIGTVRAGLSGTFVLEGGPPVALPGNEDILDDCARSDQFPPGGPWGTTDTEGGIHPLALESNKIRAPQANYFGYMTELHGPDVVFHFLEDVVHGSNGSDFAIDVRLQGAPLSSFSCYRIIRTRVSAGTFTMGVYLRTSVSAHEILDLIGPLETVDTPVAGQRTLIGAFGHKISVARLLPDSEEWELMFERSDSRQEGEGAFGLFMGDTTMRVSDLRGGTVQVPTGAGASGWLVGAIA